MKKLMSLIVATAMVATIVSGCNNAPATTSPTQTTTEPTTTTERVVTVTDMSGDTVTITGEVKKIVNLWPAGTSSFFVMGAGDLLVGLAVNSPATMNSWTRLFYPDSVNIPAMGGTTPSVEDLVNLDPDLVIIHPSTAASGLAQQIRNVGIPAININFSDYETMIQAYTILGEVLGGEYQQKLETWCNAVETKLANVRNLTKNIPESERPVVFYIAGQTESLTTTMAANSIISDWVESAGGIYAPRLISLPATEITSEAVFSLNPDVFICAGVYQHVNQHAMETTDGWKDLKAVTGNRVHKNPYGCFNWDRFGLESQMQINYALMSIQPDIAAANGINRDSMISEIVNFYKTYTNYDLSRTQAEYMLDGLQPNGTEEFPVQ